MPIRLQKYIRDKTGLSRRASDDQIALGNVTVNGRKAVLGQTIEEPVTVLVKGKNISDNLKSEERIYIMLNKPKGLVTSRNDPHNPKTVYDCLPAKYKKLFPVGRLDKETEGLLLFTNDGDFAYEHTHPKFEVEKEYYVELDSAIDAASIKKIEKGINSVNIVTSETKIAKHKLNNNKSSLIITLHEGQNREIRRIFAEFGLGVFYLKRLRFGKYVLGDLEVGQWKLLYR